MPPWPSPSRIAVTCSSSAASPWPGRPPSWRETIRSAGPTWGSHERRNRLRGPHGGSGVPDARTDGVGDGHRDLRQPVRLHRAALHGHGVRQASVRVRTTGRSRGADLRALRGLDHANRADPRDGNGLPGWRRAAARPRAGGRYDPGRGRGERQAGDEEAGPRHRHLRPPRPEPARRGGPGSPHPAYDPTHDDRRREPNVSGRVVQVSISAGGVPKRAVPSGRVTVEGLEGDGHRDREHHGGPERAVCLYAQELIEALQQEGHPVTPGALGENVTLAGLDWSALVPDACLLVGDVLLQI